MSAVLAPDPPLAPHAEPEPEPAPPARTLEELVLGTWDALAAGGAAECLLCSTPLQPRHSAGAGVVGGRCDGCGASLG